MKNTQNDDFFLSSFSLIINYKNIEIGRSKHVLSGGYNNISWSMKKALLVPLFNEKNKYWDNVIDYYLSGSFEFSKILPSSEKTTDAISVIPGLTDKSFFSSVV